MILVFRLMGIAKVFDVLPAVKGTLDQVFGTVPTATMGNAE